MLHIAYQNTPAEVSGIDMPAGIFYPVCLERHDAKSSSLRSCLIASVYLLTVAVIDAAIFVLSCEAASLTMWLTIPLLSMVNPSSTSLPIREQGRPFRSISLQTSTTRTKSPVSRYPFSSLSLPTEIIHQCQSMEHAVRCWYQRVNRPSRACRVCSLCCEIDSPERGRIGGGGGGGGGGFLPCLPGGGKVCDNLEFGDNGDFDIFGSVGSLGNGFVMVLGFPYLRHIPANSFSYLPCHLSMMASVIVTTFWGALVV